jgi:urea transport system substrate-binding protein
MREEGGPMTPNRRRFLQGAAAVAATAGQLPIAVKSWAADAINIASIYDLSGGLEAVGKPMHDLLTMAVEEINAAGGLLGRQINVISYDSQTSVQVAAQYAQEASLKNKVAVAHGGITSASREMMRPIFDRYQTLYFYDTPYEGGVCDRNIFCTAATPRQTNDKLVAYCVKTWGKKGYVLAADYNYGQITTDWVKKLSKDDGGEVIGNEFFPLDATNFGSTLSKIQAARPDWVLTVLVGAPTISFYRQWAAAGLSGRIPMASTTFGAGNEELALSPQESEGIVVCYNYIPAIDNPVNKEFLKRYYARFGANAVKVTDLAMSSYQGLHLWAAGVKKGKSIDRKKQIEALESGISLDMPSGKVGLDATTHHAIFDTHLAVFKNKQLQLLETYPQQGAVDTSAVCNLAKKPDDHQQYTIKVQ